VGCRVPRAYAAKFLRASAADLNGSTGRSQLPARLAEFEGRETTKEEQGSLSARRARQKAARKKKPVRCGRDDKLGMGLNHLGWRRKAAARRLSGTTEVVPSRTTRVFTQTLKVGQPRLRKTQEKMHTLETRKGPGIIRPGLRLVLASDLGSVGIQAFESSLTREGRESENLLRCVPH
jgi:hypothetical protein